MRRVRANKTWFEQAGHLAAGRINVKTRRIRTCHVLQVVPAGNRFNLRAGAYMRSRYSFYSSAGDIERTTLALDGWKHIAARLSRQF
jgi:hypothetical protein